MLYDATVLLSGTTKNSNRSGVFFTALNIFKCMTDSIPVTLYCKKSDTEDLKNLLSEFDISNVGFYAYDNIIFTLNRHYERIKLKINKLGEDRQYFRKLYYQIIILGLFPFHIFMKNDIFIKKYNCFFSAIYEIPREIAENKGIKKFTMLHDVIPLVLQEEEYNPDLWFIKLINSLNGNDYYICNSEYTKQDFLKHIPVIDKNKIYTSLLACNEKFRPQPASVIKKSREKYNIPEKYVFCIGNIEPRKNLERIIRTFIKFISEYKINDLSLVISGTSWTDMLEKLKTAFSDERYKDKIIFTGYIDDEDTAPLYSGALFSVYTSMYEGFGLPVLEAMSSGCPVVASKSTSIPEVAGDCAISVDYDSDEQHIEAYKTYYFNENIREENRQKGLSRAKMFSWKKCTDNIIKVMKTVSEEKL